MRTIPIVRVTVVPSFCVDTSGGVDCEVIEGFNVLAYCEGDNGAIEWYRYVNPEYSARSFAFSDYHFANGLARSIGRIGRIDADVWRGFERIVQSGKA